MGTGYVPRLLCWLLLGLGVVVLVQGLRQHAAPLRSSRAGVARGHVRDAQPRRFRSRASSGSASCSPSCCSPASARWRRARLRPAGNRGRRARADRAVVEHLHLRAGAHHPGLARVVARWNSSTTSPSGFGVALTPANLGFAFIGAMVGTLIGVLPGIGPIATIAMLLPLTFHLEPVSGLIMLAGIFYGAQYGGSTTAILVNLPGETSSVVTCIDGHQMARQGRAGAALAVAAIGSFFAGCISTALIAGFAPPLAKVGQSFGAPEYFSLMLLGLVAAVVLAHGSVDQGGGDDRARAAGRPRRHRRQHRRHALHLRHPRTDRRHRRRDLGDRRVRRRRDHLESVAAGGGALAGRAEDHAAVADRRRFPALVAGGAARHRARLDPRRAAGRRRDA